MAKPSSTGYSRGCFFSSLARDWPKLGAVARLSGMELAGAGAAECVCMCVCAWYTMR